MSMWSDLQGLFTPEQKEQADRISSALLKDPTSLDNRHPVEGEEKKSGEAK
ncbi:MAG: hypothetical protein ACHQWH_03530 [Nitrososphaerales archaeon]